MIVNYNQEEFKSAQKAFPKLRYIKSKNYIEGIISFCAKYKKNGDDWDIIQSSSGDNESFCGEYHIKIDLRSQPVKVYETAGKIKSVAEKNNCKCIDLHFFKDNSCCLDFITTKFNPKLTLTQLLFDKVYPFFVWQAYYEKFTKIPPCGEYAHEIEGYNQFIEDCKLKIVAKNPLNENSLCPCESGRKYKECCLENDKNLKTYIVFAMLHKENDIINLYEKQIKSKIKLGRNSLCPCKSGVKYKTCCLDNDTKYKRKILSAEENIKVIEKYIIKFKITL